jgi:hypothetical protein
MVDLEGRRVLLIDVGWKDWARIVLAGSRAQHPFQSLTLS